MSFEIILYYKTFNSEFFYSLTLTLAHILLPLILVAKLRDGFYILSEITGYLNFSIQFHTTIPLHKSWKWNKVLKFYLVSKTQSCTAVHLHKLQKANILEKGHSSLMQQSL